MDAAAIEEANELRVSMGLKPLPVPGAKTDQTQQASAEDEDPLATFEGRQAQSESNWKTREAEEAKKKRREEKSAAVRKAREKAQRFATLEGKGLGDLDEEVDVDAKAWLKGQKKRIKTSQRLAKEQEAAAAAAAAAKEYTSKDLAGVQVGHTVSTLLDGDEQVLTLKDTTVFENEDEGDELENADLREQEKLSERLKLKKKKPVYDPNDFDETGDRSILPQYDEDNKKKTRFTLDAHDILANVIGGSDVPSAKNKVQSLSLDILNEAPSSDYLHTSEPKVKKPKKKKSKSTRQRPVEDEDALFPGHEEEPDGPELMDVDAVAAPLAKKRKLVDESFVDDEDLQAALALQRLNTLKRKKKTRPSDIAKEMRQAEELDEEMDEGQGGGLILDEVSEFVSAIKRPDDDDDDRPRVVKPKSAKPATAGSDDEDTRMADDDEPKVESSTADEPTDWTASGVEEEKRVDEGMGAALSILRDRGLLQDGHGSELNNRYRKHEEFISAKNRKLKQIDEEARRLKDRDKANLDRLSIREREEYLRKQNASREYQTSKALQDMFNKEYTPNFDITYTDEYGRSLTAKESFKQLSHMFHGKASGNAKTSKLLKRIEEEKRQEARPMLDASQSAGMSSATAQQLKKRKEAGVRLA